ncbi:hypothetical protein ElyMa_002631200 [Elysia marginata]|uniref:SMB domain-containing protein n=1 Tax=Elysia marginata TaxID=1093978 RepID=A0AAV4H8K8_9GAST|nr:hypothetical protein ElyMa_002631200 [Elysia marginata]
MPFNKSKKTSAVFIYIFFTCVFQHLAKAQTTPGRSVDTRTSREKCILQDQRDEKVTALNSKNLAPATYAPKNKSNAFFTKFELNTTVGYDANFLQLLKSDKSSRTGNNSSPWLSTATPLRNRSLSEITNDLNSTIRLEVLARQDSNGTTDVPPWEDLHSDVYEFTCRGRCGQKIAFPCGCSASCVVYDTCCQDMAQDCPHVLRKGLLKFRHLMMTEKLCEDENPVYMITSCPEVGRQQYNQEQQGAGTGRTNEHTTGTSLKKIPRSLSLSNERSGSEEKTLRKFHHAMLLSAPVTDATTGFTFKNKTIYDCHNAPTDAYFRWSLQIEYVSENPLSLEDIEPLLETSTYYTPTFDSNLLVPHLCISNLIRNCSQFTVSSELDEYFEAKCQNRTAVVYTEATNENYANIFCLYCNQGRLDHVFLYQLNDARYLKSVFLFRISVSLSHNGDVDLTLVSPDDEIIQPWTSSHCAASGISSTSSEHIQTAAVEQPGNTVCVSQCHSLFTLRPDGLCKCAHKALVAIADDGLPPLSHSALSNLTDFVFCSLKHLMPSMRHADMLNATVSAELDTRLNKTLYVVTLLVELPAAAYRFFTDTREESDKNFHYLVILAKAFKAYRLSRNLNAETRQEGQEIKSLVKTVDMTLSRDYLETQFVRAGRYIKGPVVDSENKTTVCASYMVMDFGEGLDLNVRGATDTLFCYEDGSHQWDAELISTLEESECWDPPLPPPPGQPSSKQSLRSVCSTCFELKSSLLVATTSVYVTLFVKLNEMSVMFE